MMEEDNGRLVVFGLLESCRNMEHQISFIKNKLISPKPLARLTMDGHHYDLGSM